MITTFDPKVVEFWKERGVSKHNTLNFDGVTYWQLDVPEDHVDLKNPEYIQLLVQGKLFIYPSILRHRLKMPVHTITRRGLWVETRIGDNKDMRAFPLSRSKNLISYAYKGPGVNDDLVVKTYHSRSKLSKVFKRALMEGVTHLGIIVTKEHIEPVDLKMAIGVLKGVPA